MSNTIISKSSKFWGWLFRQFSIFSGRKLFCVHNLTEFQICFKNILFNNICFWSKVWLIRKFSLIGFSQYDENMFHWACSSWDFESCLSPKNSLFFWYEHSIRFLFIVFESNSSWVNNSLKTFSFSFSSKIVWVARYTKFNEIGINNIICVSF